MSRFAVYSDGTRSGTRVIESGVDVSARVHSIEWVLGPEAEHARIVLVDVDGVRHGGPSGAVELGAFVVELERKTDPCPDLEPGGTLEQRFLSRPDCRACRGAGWAAPGKVCPLCYGRGR